MSLGSIPADLRAQVVRRDADRCTYCGLSQAGQAAKFHIDHVTPRFRKGLTTLDNLALQCPHCSLHKATKIEGPDPLTGGVTPLFHPNRDDWNDHFTLAADGSIEGRTAVGRATVAALSMNDFTPRFARRLQIANHLIAPSRID